MKNTHKVLLGLAVVLAIAPSVVRADVAYSDMLDNAALGRISCDNITCARSYNNQEQNRIDGLISALDARIVVLENANARLQLAAAPETTACSVLDARVTKLEGAVDFMQNTVIGILQNILKAISK